MNMTMKRFGIRILVLMLCLSTVASLFSSCSYFTDAYLSEYTLGEEHTRDVLDDDTSRRYPETTRTPNTESPSTSKPETTVSVTTAPVTTVPITTVPVTTVPVTTVPITTQPPETDNVPDEFDSHVYVQYKDGGRCEEMVGEVIVTVFVLNDKVSSWNGNAKAELKKSLSAQEKELEAGAAKYGKSLDITFSYVDVSITLEATPEDEEDLWIDEAFKKAGFSSRGNAQRELDAANGADANPFMLALNKKGRAFANHRTGDGGTELVVVFSEDTTSFIHELCHVFGAKDFYYPEEVDKLAEKYLPDSVMNSGETIDPLTAFLIGWDDELDDNAYKFLDETKHLTAEYLNEENRKQSYTGQVTDYKLKYGTYTGYLLMGVAHGEGKYIYNDGEYFEGTFDYGSWQKGVGKRIYSNGIIYEGEFLNDKCHGNGTATGPNGYKYVGSWKNDTQEGYAEIIYTSGDRYAGYLVNGQRHGKGTYSWSNGAVYTGDWVNGNRTGNGTYTSKSGDKYVGEWLDSKQHGYGTMTSSYGWKYEGDWVNGTRTGYGVMIWADGSSYEGYWQNNKRHGYGKYTNRYGQVFDGQWENDVFQS